MIFKVLCCAFLVGTLVQARPAPEFEGPLSNSGQVEKPSGALSFSQLCRELAKNGGKDDLSTTLPESLTDTPIRNMLTEYCVGFLKRLGKTVTTPPSRVRRLVGIHQ